MVSRYAAAPHSPFCSDTREKQRLVVLPGNPQRYGISEVKSLCHMTYKVDFGPIKLGTGVESALGTKAKSENEGEPRLTCHPISDEGYGGEDTPGELDL